MPTRCLVLVPLRSFADTKTRLAGVLTSEERADLAMTLAAGVVDALDGWEIVVLTDDAVVADWAGGRGAAVVAPGRAGLNAAVDAGVDHAAVEGVPLVAVVHADLADPTGLGEVLTGAVVGGPNRVVAVSDRHGDGTNVLVVPTASGFRFAYGPGSFARHRDAATARGLVFDAVDAPGLGWDVDTPDDLDLYRRAGGDR